MKYMQDELLYSNCDELETLLLISRRDFSQFLSRL